MAPIRIEPSLVRLFCIDYLKIEFNICWWCGYDELTEMERITNSGERIAE